MVRSSDHHRVCRSGEQELVGYGVEEAFGDGASPSLPSLFLVSFGLIGVWVLDLVWLKIDGDLQKTGSSSSWFCGGEEPTQADFVSDASPFPPFLATFVSLTYTPLSLSQLLSSIKQAMYFPLLSLSKGRAGGLACPESIKSWVAKVEQRCVRRLFVRALFTFS